LKIWSRSEQREVKRTARTLEKNAAEKINFACREKDLKTLRAVRGQHGLPRHLGTKKSQHIAACGGVTKTRAGDQLTYENGIYKGQSMFPTLDEHALSNLRNNREEIAKKEGRQGTGTVKREHPTETQGESWERKQTAE